jgi:hypothetical protein
MRLFEGGAVADRDGIEDDHVGEHSVLDETPMVEPEIRRG